MLHFNVPLRDTSDPHFLNFNDKLFVHASTWCCGKTAPKQLELNRHLGYACWSEDGAKWRGPAMLQGAYGHYIWPAATFGDRA